MTLEEALETVTKALAPQSLNTVQIEVFRTWNKQSYHKIVEELNHEYSYIFSGRVAGRTGIARPTLTKQKIKPTETKPTAPYCW